MEEPKDIALKAVGRMRTERGDDALFSSDEIWNYAEREVPSTRRPGAINWLRQNGYIEQTGSMRHAASKARAGSMTPEYRFREYGQSEAQVDELCSRFCGDCEQVFQVSRTTTLRLMSSLAAKKFIIFTGLAGSGKTKLAQIFSQWITPTSAPVDPFVVDAEIQSDRVTYLVKKADAIAVEFWKTDTEKSVTKVTLPRAMIAEWAEYIETNGLNRETTAREIRTGVKLQSQYSDQLHSFETHLKAAAFALLDAAQERHPIKCYEIVAVGAGWSGNEHVLGYPNGLDERVYMATAALKLILQAKNNPDFPHFLILDEMNMSHVERYFADILSAIESDELIYLHGDTERWANGTAVPGTIRLPHNLFIIGTVNVDETTYMFSPKVLDRANVIEFRMEAEELMSFLASPEKPDLTKLVGKGAGFGKVFLDAADGVAIVPPDARDAFEKEMYLFFKTMQFHGAEFGYRVAHEAARFVCFYKLLGEYAEDVIWFPFAFDCVVVQKLLPKIHGSRTKVSPLLKALWFLCVSDEATRGADPLRAAEAASRSTDKKFEPTADVPDSAPYPLSAEKIARMWKLLRDNGFASFAEA